MVDFHCLVQAHKIASIIMDNVLRETDDFETSTTEAGGSENDKVCVWSRGLCIFRLSNWNQKVVKYKLLLKSRHQRQRNM